MALTSAQGGLNGFGSLVGDASTFLKIKNEVIAVESILCVTRKIFHLWCNYFAHEWHLSRLVV